MCVYVVTFTCNGGAVFSTRNAILQAPSAEEAEERVIKTFEDAFVGVFVTSVDDVYTLPETTILFSKESKQTYVKFT